jgi:hypothetical protein
MSDQDLNSTVLLKLGELCGKMDALITARAEDGLRLGIVETRVGALERSRSYIYGIGAVISAGVTIVAHYVIPGLITK